MGCGSSVASGRSLRLRGTSVSSKFIKIDEASEQWAIPSKSFELETNGLAGASEAFDVTPPLVVEDAQEEGEQFDIVKGGSAPASGPKFATRAFSQNERHDAWALSGFQNAAGGHDEPVALWIVGPSAVGKSTLASTLSPKFGIPMQQRRSVLSDGTEHQEAGAPNAVVIDGAFFREVHAGYQEWVKTDDWMSAYPAFKEIIDEEKQGILEHAAMQRKHLIIPQTCLNLASCLATVRRLERAGYTNHVLGVVAPKDEVQSRGHARANKDGKRYNPAEFGASIAAIQPMVAVCNGRYQVLHTGPPPESDGDAAAGARAGGPRLLSTFEVASGPAGQDAQIHLPEGLLG